MVEGVIHPSIEEAGPASSFVRPAASLGSTVGLQWRVRTEGTGLSKLHPTQTAEIKCVWIVGTSQGRKWVKGTSTC